MRCQNDTRSFFSVFSLTSRIIFYFSFLPLFGHQWLLALDLYTGGVLEAHWTESFLFWLVSASSESNLLSQLLRKSTVCAFGGQNIVFIFRIHCFILNRKGEHIQHTTALEVCSTFSETACFPFSAIAYWVILKKFMRNFRENSHHCSSVDALDVILTIV